MLILLFWKLGETGMRAGGRPRGGKCGSPGGGGVAVFFSQDLGHFSIFERKTQGLGMFIPFMSSSEMLKASNISLRAVVLVPWCTHPVVI